MKEQIVNLLKENENNFVSGEKISEALGVTRAAVWKYIKQLKEEGYNIESVSRKGYKLTNSPDRLSFHEIAPNLKTKFIGRKIIYLESIDSTNNEAKKLAAEGEKEGTVVISEEQTMGRGRLGRNWVSPQYKGIWMSIILRPEVDPIHMAKVTQIGAAAVCRATLEMGIKTLIKWPNDIVLNGKKLCGILTEMSAELNRVNYAVIGIGINVNTEEEDFKDEVRKVATSIKIEQGYDTKRKELIANVLNNFEELYEEFLDNGNIESSIKICKENSALIGKEIKVIEKGSSVKAKALDLTNEGRLIVEFENGKIEEIISGEVSVRGILGYI